MAGVRWVGRRGVRLGDRVSLDELARTEATREAVPPSARTTPEFAHVPALDGLRAIAVILVLLFHNYQTAPGGSHAWDGGFLGVDVFFVLSGFLITTLLLHEHQRSERIDLRRFWSRRARRLLPALFIAVVGAAILAKFAYAPAMAANVRGESISSLLYVENWYRLNTMAAPSVLSHTWSLSVEEQWYLIWPLLLGGLLLWTRGRKRLLLTAVGMLALASAIECYLLFTGNGSRSYNGTDTRAQSLLVGAGLAILLLYRPPKPSRWLQIGGWLAVVFIAVTVAKTHWNADEFMFRGGFFVFALGVALLVTAIVRSPDALLTKALAFRPLAAIGLISYGLYLYHLPIFWWLDGAHTHMRGLSLLSLRIVVTFAVAAASYYAIERPFRRGRTLDWPRVTGFVLAGTAVVAIVLVATPSSVPSAIAAATKSFTQAANSTPNGTQRVLVVGGASAFELRLGGMYDGDSVRGVAYGEYGCDVTPGDVIFNGRRYATGQKCSRLLSDMHDLTASYNPAVSVLMLGPEDVRDRAVGTSVLRPGSAAFEQLIESRLDRARRALTSRGARFVLLPVQCDGATDVPAASVNWLDQVLARYARAHTGQFTYLTALRQSCPGSHIDAKTTWPRIAAAIKAA
jgi:peptidoglycan/LPS O-acetylase OafA/YrhL